MGSVPFARDRGTTTTTERRDGTPRTTDRTVSHEVRAVAIADGRADDLVCFEGISFDAREFRIVRSFPRLCAGVELR